MILEMWKLGYNLREMKDHQALYWENDFWVSPVIRRLRVRSPSGAQKSFSQYRAWWSFIPLKSLQSLKPKGMHRFGKPRCSSIFYDSDGKNTCINYSFDCDSSWIVYHSSCKKCNKCYIGSNLNSFRNRFNNHRSSLIRYDEGPHSTPGEHLYAHFFGVDQAGLPDLSLNIIDKIDFNKPTEREVFWAYKLNTSSIEMGGTSTLVH